MTSTFEKRKVKILEELNRPADQYSDLSPKGTVDEGIRELLNFVNSLSGLVSTSSCAGRVSVFREGAKQVQFDHSVSAGQNVPDDEEQGASPEGLIASSGGKGGGEWLFVSHDPIVEDENDTQRQSLAGVLRDSCVSAAPTLRPASSADVQYVHFKFEAMILHVLTASLEDARAVLAAAAQAGFRESGAMNLPLTNEGSLMPLVAVRSAGMGFDSVIAYQDGNGRLVRLVEDAYIQTLISLANERFMINSERIQRFQAVLADKYNGTDDREDPAVRRARKRAEGLAKQHALQTEQQDDRIGQEQTSEESDVAAIFEV